MRLWRDAASQRLRRVRVEVALGLVVLVVVSACTPVPGFGNEDALSVGSNTALPEVPDADLTVVMSPGGDAPTDIQTEGVIRDSVVILATFPTNAGPGYIARYRSTNQNNDCYEAATPGTSTGSCVVDQRPFHVLTGSSGSRQRVIIEWAAVFGQPDVVAYEVELEDGFLVAIKPVDGHGYANWVGHGLPVAVTAYFGDGTTQALETPG
jgi:hypothetical protein